MTRHRPFVIALTGSIGMGKTTTAKMFAAEGIPVWDADTTVHKLYSVGGAAVPAIDDFRQGVVINNEVSREALKLWIAQDPTALKKIETVVHPLVAANRAEFLANTTAPIVVLDIPLLFETGNKPNVDMIVVVSVPESIQRQRVLSRPGMTEQQFELIIKRQMPDSEKRDCADVIIETLTIDEARQSVQNLLEQIRKKLNDA